MKLTFNDALYHASVKNLIHSNGEYIKVNIKKDVVKTSSGDEIFGPFTAYDVKLGGNKPSFLKELYSLKVLPMENHSWGVDRNKQYIYYPGARFEPYDLWFIVWEEDIRVRGGRDLFDFSENVILRDKKYKVKGKITEKEKVVHVFLNRIES